MVLELLILKDPCREISKHRVRAFGVHGGSIGRSPDSFWVLPDPNGYVSGLHCTVSFRDGTYWLMDYSRNGVFLNGSRVSVGRGNEVPLRNEDRLRIAGYEMVVRLDKQPVRLHGSHARPVPDPSADVTGEHASIDPSSIRTDPVPDLGYEEGHVHDQFAETVTLLGSDQALLESAGAVRSSGKPKGRRAPPADPGPVEQVSGSIVLPGVQASNESDIDQARIAAEASGGAASPEHFPPTGSEKVERAKPSGEFKTAALDKATMERHAILLGAPDDAALRAFKILRTRLRRRMSANHWRSVGVTGASEGVGKTVTAINLAITLAQDKRTPTYLVDMDLNRPQIGAYLGMSFDKGLSDYLLGEASIEEIVYSPGIEGLLIIPNGRPLQHASELLGSERMADLVGYLETAQPNRTILYDLPPILLSDDVLVFSPHMDCVLDVVAVGITTRASLERSKEILSELNVVGVVLNRATEQDQTGTYYYYQSRV